jgi:hypothetical protein
MDGEPVGGTRPTSQWLVGELIVDRYGLAIPADAPVGDYVIEVGMYDPETHERLPVRDRTGQRVPESRIELETVRVR